jgi:hypothetical protein
MGQTYLIRKFKPYTTPVTSAYYSSYYYGGGGIGVPNLVPRYEHFLAGDNYQLDYWFYIEIANNNVSVPPFSYNASLSQYDIVLSHNGTDFTVPLSQIEKLQSSTFSETGTWVTVTDKEELRNGFFRLSKDYIIASFASIGYTYNYNSTFIVDKVKLKYSEIWGTGNYPNGIGYNDYSVYSYYHNLATADYQPAAPSVSNVTVTGSGASMVVDLDVTMVDTGNLGKNIQIRVELYDTDFTIHTLLYMFGQGYMQYNGVNGNGNNIPTNLWAKGDTQHLTLTPTNTAPYLINPNNGITIIPAGKTIYAKVFVYNGYVIGTPNPTTTSQFLLS